jgi:hypothetical protein
MWTSRLLSIIGRNTKRRVSSHRRRMARHRTLRIEAMETRVLLSATATMLAIGPAEEIVEPADDANDTVLIGEGTTAADTTGDIQADLADNDTVVAGTSDESGSPEATVCVPVSTSEQVDSDAVPETTSDESVDDAPLQSEPTVWDTDDVNWVEETLVDTEYESPVIEVSGEEPGAVTGGDMSNDSELSDTANMLDVIAAPTSDPMSGGGGVSTTSIGIGVTPIGQPAPPVITSFDATQGLSNVWIFTGQVNYRWPWTLTIQFGGLLDGESCNVNLDGSFQFEWIFPPDTNGIVSAKAVTPEGVESNVVLELIT